MKEVSCRWMSVARAPMDQTGQAADREQEDEAQGVQQRHPHLIEPLYRVAIQLKTLTPVGMATKKVRKRKIHRAVSLMPAVNMWWPQTR